jgi:hypothetical protein
MLFCLGVRVCCTPCRCTCDVRGRREPDREGGGGGVALAGVAPGVARYWVVIGYTAWQRAGGREMRGGGSS